MINLIIADAELELIPAKIAGHPSVRATSSRRRRRAEECLLDSSLHHSAMNALLDAGRRGRPDIVHFCLLLAMDSPVNTEEDGLRVFVHTRNDIVLRFHPAIRLPRNYGRFTGLMEELLSIGEIVSPAGQQLASSARQTLGELVHELGSQAIAFSEEGKPDYSLSFLRQYTDMTLIIGGFPHGAFLSDVSKYAVSTVSIAKGKLMAWTVVATVLAAYRLTRLWQI
jgi:rRNA small subunit pseudouridine methyltransferase Nep1